MGNDEEDELGGGTVGNYSRTVWPTCAGSQEKPVWSGQHGSAPSGLDLRLSHLRLQPLPLNLLLSRPEADRLKSIQIRRRN
ncbi:hypothetical protein TanjilG_25656 [Lupinus angustifolius]|uniref:Uncharacterized protein n=1 Tax=Lupinus angustifolius TaxID=3871 RepID=A0A4P1QTS4_LUPAN|nr:hypothetical protein TanjilG_25656 [Lupinus angustifolius]